MKFKLVIISILLTCSFYSKGKDSLNTRKVNIGVGAGVLYELLTCKVSYQFHDKFKLGVNVFPFLSSDYSVYSLQSNIYTGNQSKLSGYNNFSVFQILSRMQTRNIEYESNWLFGTLGISYDIYLSKNMYLGVKAGGNLMSRWKEINYLSNTENVGFAIVRGVVKGEFPDYDDYTYFPFYLGIDFNIKM